MLRADAWCGSVGIAGFVVLAALGSPWLGVVALVAGLFLAAVL